MWHLFGATGIIWRAYLADHIDAGGCLQVILRWLFVFVVFASRFRFLDPCICSHALVMLVIPCVSYPGKACVVFIIVSLMDSFSPEDRLCSQ